MSDNQQYAMKYNVDLVFCIDSTGSMAHIINMVKQRALSLYGDILADLERKHKYVDQLRVRVVAFRDYLADGEKAMLTSDFFTLPQEESSLQECVSLIDAEGGGDPPEDGLEALAYAMRSQWVTTGVKKRHVIVLWTDAPTHDIGYGASCPTYPAGMPASFDELSRWWNDPQEGGVMNRNAKRLILFAPDLPAWSRISASWDQTIHVRTVSEGLSEIDYQQVLDVVGNSI